MPVVVGVDGSPVSNEAVRRAIAIAKATDEEVHLVHVFHPPITPYLGAPFDMSGIANAEREEVWASVNQTGAPSSMVTRVDLEGYPPDVLVDYVKNVGADLLVVGTRGRGEFAALILGSTSHRAIHLAPGDVLGVKPSHA